MAPETIRFSEHTTQSRDTQPRGRGREERREGIEKPPYCPGRFKFNAAPGDMSFCLAAEEPYVAANQAL
jgi:hypothetical protein